MLDEEYKALCPSKLVLRFETLLGCLVIFVLAGEWLVERCLGETLTTDLEIPRKTRTRTFVEGWYDGFKICTGIISHRTSEAFWINITHLVP